MEKRQTQPGDFWETGTFGCISLIGCLQKRPESCAGSAANPEQLENVF